jgi:hypothetical protein
MLIIVQNNFFFLNALQGVKSFGIRFQIILKLFQFGTLKYKTNVRQCVKVFFMSMTTFVAFVTPCDL